MKQIFAIFAILLLMPLAFAQTENETTEPDETQELVENPTTGEDIADDKTQDEVKTMDTPKGAKVRLLQLEKRIDRNIVRAQEVVAYIKETYSDADVVELETLIQEMQMLRDQVKAISTDNPDYGTAKLFVDLKNDAIELSKTFKDKAHAILMADDIEKVKKRATEREQERTELIEQKEEVVQAIREYNSYRVQTMLEAMGITDSTLAKQVKNGEISYGEANSEIMKQYAALSSEEKQAVKAKFKETLQKKENFKREAVKQAKLQYLERREERLQQKIEKINQFNESAVANRLIAQRINKIEMTNAKTVSRKAVVANE